MNLVYANQAVEEAKEHSNQGITFKSDAIDWKTCVIVTVSDTSWSNEEEKTKKELKKYKSQRARMAILANPDFLEKEGSTFHVLSWQSTIIRRVCRNTLQAETYGVNFAIEEGIRMRAVLAEVHGKLPNLRKLGGKDEIFQTTHLDHRLQKPGRTFEERYNEQGGRQTSQHRHSSS